MSHPKLNEQKAMDGFDEDVDPETFTDLQRVKFLLSHPADRVAGLQNIDSLISADDGASLRSKSQLVHGSCLVRLDRLDGDPQLLGHRFVAMAGNRQPQHFDFAFAEFSRFGRPVAVGTLRRRAYRLSGDGRIEIQTARSDRLHRPDEFVGCRALQQVTGNAELKKFAQIAAVFVHRQNQDLAVRTGFPNQLGDLDAIEPR